MRWQLGMSGIDPLEEYLSEGQRKQGNDLVMKPWFVLKSENVAACRQEY